MSTPPPGPILIYGAGAVGQFVGGTLALAGHDVTLLARPTLEAALAAGPLQLVQEATKTITASEERVALRAVSTIAALAAPPQLILLTVKSYDTAAALPDLRQLVEQGAVVLTLQNGVGNEEALMAGLGGGAVRSGAFTISVSTPTPGQVVRHTLKGGLGFAPIAGEEIGALVGLFAATGLPVVVAHDYRTLKWSKLLLNMLGNALGALLALPPAQLFSDRRLFAVERRAFLEARAVMRAAGIGLTDLPAYPVRLLTRVMELPGPLAQQLAARRLGGGRGAKLPSLALDLQAGRGRSELAWYNGAIVALGEQLGVPTPVNRALTRLLTTAMSDPEAWAALRGDPARVLAALTN